MRRFSLWDVVYIVLLVLAIPAGIFHLLSGRYAQALIAAVAIVIGGVVVATGLLRPTLVASPTPSSQPSRAPRTPALAPAREPERLPSGRVRDWLPLSILAGFAGTGGATVALLMSYGWIVQPLGASLPQGTILQRWFAHLAANLLTQRVFTSLAAAIILNFAAGILWAVIYAAWFEPRLNGPGWRRGLIFALLPWLASIVIFFPVMGAGIFGVKLGAGPLPVIGNLILHLVYGALMGEAFVVQQTLAETPEEEAAEEPVLNRAQRIMGWAIVPGFLAGALLALVGKSLFSPNTSSSLVFILGGLLGSALGVMIGSYAGLGEPGDLGERERSPVQ